MVRKRRSPLRGRTRGSRKGGISKSAKKSSEVSSHRTPEGALHKRVTPGASRDRKQKNGKAKKYRSSTTRKRSKRRYNSRELQIIWGNGCNRGAPTACDLPAKRAKEVQATRKRHSERKRGESTKEPNKNRTPTASSHESTARRKKVELLKWAPGVEKP